MIGVLSVYFLAPGDDVVLRELCAVSAITVHGNASAQILWSRCGNDLVVAIFVRILDAVVVVGVERNHVG